VPETQASEVHRGASEPHRVVSPDSPARVLVAAAARALRGEDCSDLGYQPILSRFRGAPEPVRRAAVARAAARAALAPEEAAAADADLIARWLVDHYPPRSYPGVVLGSPHGAAVHLAVALGVPWLPTGFEMSVHWPGGAADDPAAALDYGARVASAIVEGSLGVGVRQVHDPVGRGVLAGSTITLVVRWQHLPAAYRRFLSTQLAPGAPLYLLRDARTWPVLDSGNGHSFQVGGPASGMEPTDFEPDSDPLGQVLRGVGGDRSRWRPPGFDCPQGYGEHAVEPSFESALRDWADQAANPVHRVLFPRPDALSAATADVYRQWLRSAGKTGNRCVVECGRLIDPWQVVRAGLVPYWCENATQRNVAGAELWLAGSAAFNSVDVLPEPPGLQTPGVAGLPQWLAVASFGRRRGAVDRVAARGYPVSPIPTRHATEALQDHPYDLPAPPPLRPVEALAGLRACGTSQGLLVC
jgi:hypothetical protein